MTKRKVYIVTPENVINAMRALVQWDTMYTFCQTGSCKECPYGGEKMICNKRSTASVMHDVSAVFDRFLKQKEREVQAEQINR